MPIYIIQAGTDGPVKIGWSVDVAARLKNLQVCHYEELRLLRTIDGDAYSEEFFQTTFAHLRIRGEWYHFHPSMLADVDLDEIRSKYYYNFVNFRAWRKSLGLSQIKVSELLGRPLHFIQEFEYYGKVPDALIQTAMAEMSRGARS